LMTALYAGYSHFFKVKPVTVTANGEIRVTRSQDGHHYLSGVINGQSIRFLIDTGATYTSVSEVFAQKALLEGGNRATSQTANGPIPIRLVRDVNIKIGDIDVSGLTVSVGLRGLQDDLGLLGQNFLSQFDAITQGNVLILKPRER
jgi:aspartyl protease family protein